MDIYAYLKKDHQKVKDLMEQLLASRSDEKREELFEQVCDELILHSETEDATFYAALKNQKETREKIEHAKEEHEEVEDYLMKIEDMSMSSGEKWMEQFGELRHAVLHHIEEEEGEIFEKAKKILSSEQAKELAAEMDALKQEKKASEKGGKAHERRVAQR